QAEDGIRDFHVTGVQTCALPILRILGARIAKASDPATASHGHDVRILRGSTLCAALTSRGTWSTTTAKPAAERGNGRPRRRCRRSEERRVGKESGARWSCA